MAPVASVTAFGKTITTAKGDHGKTFNCVWNEAFSFTKSMDEEEFSKEVINIRVEDSRFFGNTLIGAVKFEAQTVSRNKDHEFYQLQYPLVNLQRKKDGNVSMQGQLEVSVCVYNDKDVKESNGAIPVHIYDAEVEMWAELQHKQEVMGFDADGKFLQNSLDQKAAEDAAAKVTDWDIIHVKVYKAEDLPKLDRGGWIDAYISLEYKGLMDKGMKLKSKPVKDTMSPVWNMEFTLPIAHGVPLIYDSFELVVKDHNLIGKNEWVGKCSLNLSDILKLPQGSPPMWKSLYQDIDEHAPTYRGRVLIEVSVEEKQKSAKMTSAPCSPVREELLPPSGSYRLDFELLEGMHLLENYSDYQVDVTLGHSMSLGGGTGEEAQREREKCGKAWVTIESDAKVNKGANKTIVPFLTKKSIMVHNLPYPRRLDMPNDPAAPGAAAADASEELDKLPAVAPLSPSGTVKPQLSKEGYAVGFKGDAANLAFNSIREDFCKDTCLLDYKSMMPDLILYVSKKGDRKACVGYLRIPLNGLTRPTENWEHGEDLTIFPYLWEPAEGCARALPLKPLKELYQLTSGFLLFKASLTPVSAQQATMAKAQHVTAKLEPVPRQRYKFVANVYQAKDMASVDPSGLSSPLCTVQIGDVIAKTKHKMLTCNPLWFEALTAEVELPVNLMYAPDFACTCYHFKEGLFRVNDKATFMGRADVPAHLASTTHEVSSPAWYPLQFEEHQYGNILLAFRLTPIKAGAAVEVVQSGIERLISGWENYAVEISALDIRGGMAALHKKKKIDPVYQIECWEDVQNFQASKIAGDKFTVYMRKPANPVFYSAVNFRVYEGKELTGVTSIPINKILRSGAGWYKLMELILRDELMTQKRVVRQWRKFIRQKHYVDPRTIRKQKRTDLRLEYGTAVSSASTSVDSEEHKDEVRDHRHDPSEDGHEDVAFSSPSMADKYRFKPEEHIVYTPNDITINVNDAGDDKHAIELGVRSDDALARAVALSDTGSAEVPANAMKPRLLDAEGNEVFEEKDMQYLQCPKLPDVDAGNKFEMHWRVECEYEMLPLVNDPFIDNELFQGKDEIHATFLDKLFSRGKRSVGHLRGNFFSYRIGAIPARGAAAGGDAALGANRVNPLFDAQRYFNPLLYTVRVYVLRGLQLVTKKGRASGCDPFVSISLPGCETVKTSIKDGTANPQWYCSFDFPGIPLPSLQSALTMEVFNDNSIFSTDLIGSTEVQLENRIFSKPWQAGQKPIERRALKKTKTGRLPMGFLEVVVEVLPMQEAGLRTLDYLLDPPRRMPWELRVTLWECEKVTLKQIHHSKDECCCVELCAPPDQSDIQLIAGMSGSKQKPQSTDVHPRSIDGSGVFNWRTVFDVELPSPKMLCNLKVQVWNINLFPNDCISEAIIPLWGFFELARRNADKAAKEFPGDPFKQITELEKQWVQMKHPLNDDNGRVRISIELLPKEIAGRDEFKAAAGEKGFDKKLNMGVTLKEGPRCLDPPKRPWSSFPWWRLDKQILWRCMVLWHKIRWYVAGLVVLAAGLLALFIYLKATKKI